MTQVPQVPRPPVYNPGVFTVASISQAKAIILTPEMGTTTDERWEKETRFLVNDIGQHLAVGKDSCVLDYGCGIGRMAKALIDRYGCRVIGVDISESMRLLAPHYVLSERFTVWAPETLDLMIAKGFRADGALCLWVLQHVLAPATVVRQIADAMKAGGLLYSLNQRYRCVPTNLGWVNDGFDMRAGLSSVFKEEHLTSLPRDATTAQMAAGSIIQILRKPAVA